MYLECEGFVHVGCLDCLFQNRRRLGYKYAQNFNRDCQDEGDSFLNKVITCDETWFHLFFESESKQQSLTWKHTWSPLPIKARLSKSVGKVMPIIFCDTKGIVLNHMVPDKTIVNGDFYSGVL